MLKILSIEPKFLLLASITYYKHMHYANENENYLLMHNK